MKIFFISIVLFFVFGCETESKHRKEVETFLSQNNYLETNKETITFKGKVNLALAVMANDDDFCPYDFESEEYEISMKEYKIIFTKNDLTRSDKLIGWEWSYFYEIKAPEAKINWKNKNFGQNDCVWMGGINKFHMENERSEKIFNFNKQNVWQNTLRSNEKNPTIILIVVSKKDGLLICDNCTYPNPGFLSIN